MDRSDSAMLQGYAEGIPKEQIEELQQAIHQAATDKKNGREAMFRNIRGMPSEEHAILKPPEAKTASTGHPTTPESGQIVPEELTEEPKEAKREAKVDTVTKSERLDVSMNQERHRLPNTALLKESEASAAGSTVAEPDKTTPKPKENEKEESVSATVPSPHRYIRRGKRIREDEENPRPIAKPKKKLTQNVLKTMFKTKMDKIVSQFTKDTYGVDTPKTVMDKIVGQFTKEELDMSVTKSPFAPGLGDLGLGIETAETAAPDSHLFDLSDEEVEPGDNEDYSVKNGSDGVDLDGPVVDEVSADEEQIDYQLRQIHSFPMCNTPDASPEVRFHHHFPGLDWMDAKHEAAQDELVEYWSQFDKFT